MKLITLISLIALTACNEAEHPKLIKLNEKNYKKFKEKFKYSLILIFEEWCHFSKNALKIFKELSVDPLFLELDIPVGFMNTYKLDEFKKLNGIKKVPIITLHIGKAEIFYEDEVNKQEILDFVMKKTKLSKIKKIKGLEEFKTQKEKDSKIYLFYGEENSPRFKIFAEGYYHYPRKIFFWTDDPYIRNEYKLQSNKIYLFTEDQFKPIEYKRAFKKNRFLEWIVLNSQRRYLPILNKEYDRMLRIKNPIMVLFKNQSKASEDAFQLIRDYSTFYYEDLDCRICDVENQDCKDFIQNLPFSADKTPFLFVMAFHDNHDQPLFYFQKNALSLSNFKNFITSFIQKRLRFEIFSETLEFDQQYNVNNNAKKVVRSEFRTFLVENIDKDILFLYYNSKDKETERILKEYKDQALKVFESDQNRSKIAFGYFDILKNSHEAFNLQNKRLVVRLYKYASLTNSVDASISLETHSSFTSKLLNFLHDATTERLDLPQFYEEM